MEVKNEIQNLLKCDNQHIVRYIHSEKVHNGFLIALELCEKFTLADRVEDKTCLRIDIDPIEVLRQTIQGLQFLHQPEINIIHRDLKPSNILFKVSAGKVKVKISDFGISRPVSPGKTSRTCTSFDGTVGWTAAEVLEAGTLLSKFGSKRSQIPNPIPRMVC